MIGLNLFQANESVSNPVQQYNSLNSPTLSLTNKSISPPDVVPTVSRYAAGNIIYLFIYINHLVVTYIETNYIC